MATGKHAAVSPSGAHKWYSCAAAPAMELYAQAESKTPWAAAEGTAGGYIAEVLLKEGRFTIPQHYYAKLLHVYVPNDGSECELIFSDNVTRSDYSTGTCINVTDELLDMVGKYLANLADYKGHDGMLLIEEPLEISEITGEPGAKGTPDALILRGAELQIHDLKLGRKAANMAQLEVYACAAYQCYSSMFLIDKVVLAIHQPRIDFYPVKEYSAECMDNLVEDVSTQAKAASALIGKTVDDLKPHCTPGDHCSEGYCKARNFCTPLRDMIQKTVFENPKDAIPGTDANSLSRLASIVPMIKGWCAAIEEELNNRVLGGGKVPGFKIVRGYAGPRKWSDDAEAEAKFRELKIPEEVYVDFKLKSPTSMEALCKAGAITKDEWKAVQQLVARAPGKPIVVPDSDRRDAIDPVEATADDFEDLN